MIRLTRTTFWEEVRLGKSCGESTSKTPIEALDKALKYLESVYQS